MIIIAVTYKAKPGQREKALQAALTCSKITKQEEGNIDYTFYVGLDSSDTFFLFEQWENKSFLEKHMKSAHLAAFREALAELLAEPSVIKLFDAQKTSL